MRIFHACGNPECGEEYPTDTRDRVWVCPHCERELPNPFYPFLTARLMHARIHSEETDWKDMHDQLFQEAASRAEDLRKRVQLLRKDLMDLRVRLPEEAQEEVGDLQGAVDVEPFIDSWRPQAPEGDMEAWRELHDQLLEGARHEVIALEDAVSGLEGEIRDTKSRHSLA